MYHLKIRIMKKAVDYLKSFSLTNETVSMEELHSFVQMQKQVSDYPIPFFTDGYYFFVDEVCDEKMYYADIAWAETVKTNQSLIHMKDGKSFALPISALGTERFLSQFQSALVCTNQHFYVCFFGIHRNGKQTSGMSQRM